MRKCAPICFGVRTKKHLVLLLGWFLNNSLEGHSNIMLDVHLAMLVHALTVLVIDGYLYILIYPIKTHFSGQSLGVASSANTHVYNADSVMDIIRAS